MDRDLQPPRGNRVPLSRRKLHNFQLKLTPSLFRTSPTTSQFLAPLFACDASQARVAAYIRATLTAFNEVFDNPLFLA